MGRGSLPPSRQEPHPALGPSGLVSTGLRAQPITELATVLMTDFKYRPIEVHIFPVSENGENVLSYEGTDGAMPSPPNFWARTAPASNILTTCDVV